MGTASLGPGSWLKAAQIPAGGDVSSMNPIETSARARMRGAKLTASKYAAVRPTSGRSTSQLGYGAARHVRDERGDEGVEPGEGEALLAPHARPHHHEGLTVPVGAARQVLGRAVIAQVHRQEVAL